MVPIQTPQRRKHQLFLLGCVILLSIDQHTYAQDKQVYPNSKGTKPHYTTDFNKWANKQSPNTKLTTKRFFTGLLAHKQDSKLGTAVLSSLLGRSTKTQ